MLQVQGKEETLPATSSPARALINSFFTFRFYPENGRTNFMTVISQMIPGTARDDFVQQFKSSARSQGEFQTFLESFKIHEIKTEKQQTETAKPPKSEFTKPVTDTQMQERCDEKKRIPASAHSRSSQSGENIPSPRESLDGPCLVAAKPDYKLPAEDCIAPGRIAFHTDDAEQIESAKHSPVSLNEDNTVTDKKSNITDVTEEISTPKNKNTRSPLQTDIQHKSSSESAVVSCSASRSLDLKRILPNDTHDDAQAANEKSAQSMRHVEEDDGSVLSAFRNAASESEKVEINSRLVKGGALSDVTIYLDDGSCFKCHVETRNSIHTTSFVEQNPALFMASRKGFLNYSLSKHRDKK